MMKISERYKKSLVTVAMGFRTEEDIKKNGLYRFSKKEKENAIKYIKSLFEKKNNVIVLKIKEKGYRSEHININSEEKLNDFINNISSIYGKNNEIWVVSSSVIECWRCRIYLSNNDKSDILEMAYSIDDHILDHIDSNETTPYICYKKNNKLFEISNTNLEKSIIEQTNQIKEDMIRKYDDILNKVKTDMKTLKIDGISLDVRVNNGYDFHDFDVSYKDVEKVVNYYMEQFEKNRM